jgi:hypothetical protein
MTETPSDFLLLSSKAGMLLFTFGAAKSGPPDLDVVFLKAVGK